MSNWSELFKDITVWSVSSLIQWGVCKCVCLVCGDSRLGQKVSTGKRRRCYGATVALDFSPGWWNSWRQSGGRVFVPTPAWPLELVHLVEVLTATCGGFYDDLAQRIIPGQNLPPFPLACMSPLLSGSVKALMTRKSFFKCQKISTSCVFI